ncbi:hypothetical protein L195_g037779, partial [Trifolium pratense]
MRERVPNGRLNRERESRMGVHPEREALFNLGFFVFSLSQSISLPILNNANKFTLNVRVTLQPHSASVVALLFGIAFSLFFYLKYFDDYKCGTSSKDKLDEVKDDWAEYMFTNVILGGRWIRHETKL